MAVNMSADKSPGMEVLASSYTIKVGKQDLTVRMLTPYDYLEAISWLRQRRLSDLLKSCKNEGVNDRYITGLTLEIAMTPIIYTELLKDSQSRLFLVYLACRNEKQTDLSFQFDLFCKQAKSITQDLVDNIIYEISGLKARDEESKKEAENKRKGTNDFFDENTTQETQTGS